MEHYITQVRIKKLRHLQNIDIQLNKNRRQHLILTGKNGSGKTTLIEAIRSNLDVINGIQYINSEMDSLNTGIDIQLSNQSDIDAAFSSGSFITAFFGAKRALQVQVPEGVERIIPEKTYSINDNPSEKLLKYMVHLKAQQSFANNEKHVQTSQLIQNWFTLFENALKKLMDDSTVWLEFSFQDYNFIIHQNHREPYDFTQLSDGYSAALQIVADLLMRMDNNWLRKNTSIDLKEEGIVLIDEIETHLHLELQKTIMPFLTEMFPNIQFIVTTHSPFVVISVPDAAIFDLENHTFVKNGLSDVGYEGAVSGCFPNLQCFVDNVETK